MTPAGTSNELDVQNGWEENTHTHTGGHGTARGRHGTGEAGEGVVVHGVTHVYIVIISAAAATLIILTRCFHFYYTTTTAVRGRSLNGHTFLENSAERL